jgi:hypothetical protein
MAPAPPLRVGQFRPPRHRNGDHEVSGLMVVLVDDPSTGPRRLSIDHTPTPAGHCPAGSDACVGSGRAAAQRGEQLEAVVHDRLQTLVDAARALRHAANPQRALAVLRDGLQTPR